MKILHTASHWGLIRGGAVQLSRIAAEQHLRGHEITVLFPDQLFKNPVLRKKHLDSWKPLSKTGVKVKKIGFRSINGINRLGSFLKNHPVDVIHVHRNEALIKTTRALAREKIQTPVVVQRGTITMPQKEHLLAAFKSPNVKAYTVVADAVKEILVSALGEERLAMIHTVYGSVDTNSFSFQPPDQRIIHRLGFPENAKIVGSLSSYRKSKRLDLLLSALSTLMARDNRIRAVFLGTGMDKEILPLARQLGIDKKICFPGFQTDIRPWLSVMDVSVVSADAQEGLSGVLRESLAMEIPVISTECAGNVEIIHHKKTGLLVPVNQEPELAHAIAWALANTHEMKKMAKNGRKWIVENCSVKTQVDHLDTIYTAICRK